MSNEIQTVRTLDTVAAEINAFTASMFNNVIEIGRRMVEAKEMVPYGQFGDWIRENTAYSVSTANSFMRIYKEYGSAQSSLFGGETESQTFGKLSYTKALALLAVPAEEREEFVENHDVEAMSTRELQKAIRERDEALAAAEGSALRIGELESARDKAEEELAEAEAEAKRLKAQIRELESRPVAAQPSETQEPYGCGVPLAGNVAVQEADPEAVQAAVDEALAKQAKEGQAKLEELQDKLKTASTKESALQVELDKVKADLKAARDKAKTAKADAEAAAGKEAQTAKAEAEQAKAEAERLRKELAMADAVTAQFKAHFATAQGEINSCLNLLDQAAPETKDKLKAALAALMDAVKEKLDK